MSIAYHNGTSRHVTHVPPLPGFLQLLQRFQGEADGRSLRNPWAAWREHRLSSPAQSIKSNRLTSLWQYAFFRWRSPSPVPSMQQGLSPETSLFSDIFETLQSATTLTGYPMKHIGLSLPPYFTDNLTIYVLTAAYGLNLEVKDIAHAPAAVAAAHEIDICRVPSEYLPCERERIMTLDMSDAELTAEFLSVEPGFYLGQERAYAINHFLGSRRIEQEVTAATAWINAFAQKSNKTITKLYLIGQGTGRDNLKKAVIHSEIASALQDLVDDGIQRIAADGMAKLTKMTMEEQETDCLEPERCERLREEADRLAGRPCAVFLKL